MNFIGNRLNMKLVIKLYEHVVIVWKTFEKKKNTKEYHDLYLKWMFHYVKCWKVSELNP